jgi:hypothetical protein
MCSGEIGAAPVGVAPKRVIGLSRGVGAAAARPASALWHRGACWPRNHRPGGRAGYWRRKLSIKGENKYKWKLTNAGSLRK